MEWGEEGQRGCDGELFGNLGVARVWARPITTSSSCMNDISDKKIWAYLLVHPHSFANM